MPTPDLSARFRHHPPRGEEDVRAHQRIRAAISQAAHVVDTTAPDGREKATAITKLEEAMMWANAAVARAGAAAQAVPFTAPADVDGAVVRIRKTMDRLHPRWDDVASPDMAEEALAAAAAGKLAGVYEFHLDGDRLLDGPAPATSGAATVLAMDPAYTAVRPADGPGETPKTLAALEELQCAQTADARRKLTAEDSAA